MIQVDKYSPECSIKYSWPYLLCLFLIAMWLFNTARRKNQSKYGKLYFIEHSSEY